MGVVAGGPVIGHLHMTPGLVRVEEDEQIGRAVALVFAIVSLGLARRGRDRQTGLADQLGRAFVEANYRSLRIVLRRFEYRTSRARSLSIPLPCRTVTRRDTGDRG